MLREIGLHFLGQFEPLVLFQHPGKAALAALRIDADHRLVIAPEIGLVNRQIMDAPVLVILPLTRFEALLYRILVARSEEHTSELQSLMFITYALFCLKKHTTNDPMSFCYL